VRGRLRVRHFRAADAARLVTWLDPLTPAEDVLTPGSLLHQRRMLPARRHPLWLVALADGEPIGLGYDEPQIFASQPGRRRIWVAVRPDMRGRGVGSALWRELFDHARSVGGRVLRSRAIADAPQGERFLRARGFRSVDRYLQSWVDPTTVSADELRELAERARRSGFQVRALGELLPAAEPALRKLFQAADNDMPRPQPGTRPVAASTFRRVIFDNPILDRVCSTVVLHAEEPVALCWLKGDRALGRYAVEFTGTAPAWRGQGLARLAKLSALQLAAQAGVRWVGTANDERNAPMLAINRRLGHNRLADLVNYELELTRPEAGRP
jgi:mycothiol synthase